MRYKLTAVSGRHQRSAKIVADDSFDATMQAIEIVLDRAHKSPSGPWALGRIELRDPSGSLIHSMDAKVPA